MFDENRQEDVTFGPLGEIMVAGELNEHHRLAPTLFIDAESSIYFETECDEAEKLDIMIMAETGKLGDIFLVATS